MNHKKTWLIAFVFCLLLGTMVPLASSAPDGLERVAEDKGFIEMGRSSPFSIMAGYVFPGVESEVLATILASWLGIILIFLLVYCSTKLIYRLKGRSTHP